MTGGSDTAKLGEIWPEYLNKSLPAGSNVHWIVGPFSNQPNLILKNLNFKFINLLKIFMES